MGEHLLCSGGTTSHSRLIGSCANFYSENVPAVYLCQVWQILADPFWCIELHWEEGVMALEKSPVSVFQPIELLPLFEEWMSEYIEKV